MREQLIVWLYKFSFKFYGRLKTGRKEWLIPLHILRQYPVGSLGYDVADFLDKHGLNFQYKHESHDFYHTILGYETDVESEISMQFFLAGSGKRTIYLMGTLAIGLAVFPEKASFFIKHYQQGKMAEDISRWDFEDMLHEKTALLRARLYREMVFF